MKRGLVVLILMLFVVPCAWAQVQVYPNLGLDAGAGVCMEVYAYNAAPAISYGNLLVFYSKEKPLLDVMVQEINLRGQVIGAATTNYDFSFSVEAGAIRIFRLSAVTTSAGTGWMQIFPGQAVYQTATNRGLSTIVVPTEMIAYWTKGRTKIQALPGVTVSPTLSREWAGEYGVDSSLFVLNSGLDPATVTVAVIQGSSVAETTITLTGPDHFVGRLSDLFPGLPETDRYIVAVRSTIPLVVDLVNHFFD